jgi:hypothetical protein
MSTTPHPFAPEEIMAHLDGELGTDRTQSVSAHLESCAACQELVTSLRNTAHSLSAWTVAPAPATPTLQKRLESFARENSLASRTGDSSLSRLTGRWTRRQLVAGLAFASVASLFIAVIAVPNLFRTQRARSHTVRLEVAEKGKSSIGLDGPLKAQKNSRVFTDQLPLESGASSLNSTVTLSKPGVAADSNGLFHGFGDHASNSFSIDGQPRTDQQSRVFTGPMIARTISLSIVAKDFDAARASLDTILARHNGYSASLAVNTPQGAARSLQASLRVPAPQLSAAVIELKSLGRVEIETQSGEEVTQPHADLVARLKNAHETESRIQAMLKERTGNIGEVLGAEQEIARVRGEIEWMEAEQKNLEHRVDFVTIDLNLSEEYKAQLEPPAPALSTIIHNALVSGYRNVAGTLLALVIFFAAYGPVLIFWLLVLVVPATIVWRRWHRAAAI